MENSEKIPISETYKDHNKFLDKLRDIVLITYMVKHRDTLDNEKDEQRESLIKDLDSAKTEQEVMEISERYELKIHKKDIIDSRREAEDEILSEMDPKP